MREPFHIVKNAIICPSCGEEAESKTRHHYSSCKCGEVAADGGKEYFRRTFRETFGEASIIRYWTKEELDANQKTWKESPIFADYADRDYDECVKEINGRYGETVPLQQIDWDATKGGGPIVRKD